MTTTTSTEPRGCPLLQEVRESLAPNPTTTKLTLVLRQNSDISAWTELLRQTNVHRIEHLVITTTEDSPSEPQWTTPAAQNLFVTLGQSLPRLQSLQLEGLGSRTALDEDAVGFPLFLLMLLLVSLPSTFCNPTTTTTLVESLTIQNCRFMVAPDPTLAQQCGRLFARVVTQQLTQVKRLVWEERIFTVPWTTWEEETRGSTSTVMDLPCVTDAILALPRLQQLHIAGRYPGGDGPGVLGTIHHANALATFLSKNATSLKLQNVRLGLAALGALANAIADPVCSLQTLHVDLGTVAAISSRDARSGTKAQHLLHFVRALKTNTCLETLDLGISYDQRWHQYKIVSQLATALRDNRTLSTLQLYSGSQTDSNALPQQQQQQQQQQENHVVPERNLFNFFDPVVSVCDGDPNNNNNNDNVIKEGHSATHHPTFPEEDAAAFVQLLEVNTTLKYVRLDDYNALYDDNAAGRWASLLEYYTDTNIWYDRHNIMLHSASNNQWFEVVASAANHCNVQVAVEATYYWLRQNPSFAAAAAVCS